MDIDNSKDKTPVPMPQRLRDFLKERIRKEESILGRKGILGPLSDIAGKETLGPDDADYLSLNYNLSRKFMRTGKGAPYNHFHADDRFVVDFNGEAYRKTFIPLFQSFLCVAEDLEDIVDYVQTNYSPEELGEDLCEALAGFREEIEHYDSVGKEMIDKLEALDREGIPTYCMSKATLLGYVYGAVGLILLYQEIFEFFSDLVGMPRQWMEDDNEETELENPDNDGPDIGLLASFGRNDGFPS